MLSFRDRFFTPKVATAMMSPLAIVAAGGGGAAGILAGGAAGPVGAIVGGIVGAIAAWAVRVGLAVPKAPEQTRIDPFTLAEPWRRLTQDAIAARTQFNDAVRRTKPGPIRDRLASIGQRLEETINEAWAAARAGHELTDAYTRIDAKGAQRDLDAITSSGRPLTATSQATVDALQAQLSTAIRMYETITATRDRLQLLNARLDESVARCIELSVGTYKPDAFSEVEGAVGSITDELEALRGAIEDTSVQPLPVLPDPDDVPGWDHRRPGPVSAGSVTAAAPGDPAAEMSGSGLDPVIAAPRNLARNSMWVAAGTASSRLTGFIRVFALSYAVGQGALGNLFTKANSAPNLVFELVIGGVLSATLLPVFVSARERDDDDAASALLTVGFVVSAALALVALGGTALVDLIWSGHLRSSGASARSIDHFHIVTSLLYLLLPQILFYGMSSLATAYLNAARRYRTAAFAPVLTNLVCIAAYIIVGRQLQGEQAIIDGTERSVSALLWLGLGTTVGIFAMTVPMLIDLRRTGAEIRFLPTWRHPVIGKVTKLSGWTFGYVIANQAALWTVLALLADQKRYSDAFIFFQLPHGLIAVTIMTTMTPELASAAARLDFQGHADQFVRGLRLLAALIIPAAIGYILLARPITSFLVRGNLSAADATATARVVVAFAIGLPAFSTYLFACQGFYALSDTRTPFLLNVFENGVNIVLLIGLTVASAATPATFAVAYSIAYLLAALAALARLDRALRERDRDVRRPSLEPIGRMAIAALAMGGAVWLVRLALPADAGGRALLAVVVSVVVGGGVYAAAGVALGIEETRSAVAAIGRRLTR